MKNFKDSLDTAVFTTIFVVTDKKEVTYVTHEFEDEAWQFFSDDQFEDYEKVSMIVGLGEIIDLDKTLIEIADLPLGYIATRQSIRDKWTIEQNINAC